MRGKGLSDRVGRGYNELASYPGSLFCQLTVLFSPHVTLYSMDTPEAMEKSVQQVLQWAKEVPLLLPFMLYRFHSSFHLHILLPFFTCD